MKQEHIKPFIHLRVHYRDGSSQEVEIRLSPDEAIAYYLGKPWTWWDALKGREYTTIADKVEILSDGETIREAKLKEEA